MKFNKDKGLFLPKEKPESEPMAKGKRPTEWDCPHCGSFYDKTKQDNSEYTVGSFNLNSIPHIRCLECKECMGCLGDN